MSVQFIGLNEINGPLVVLDHVKNASFDEVCELTLSDGTRRTGRIVEMEGERVVVQVFEGTNGLSLKNTRTRFTGHPMEMPLSTEVLGRIFSGAGKPIDGLGDIYPEKYAGYQRKTAESGIQNLPAELYPDRNFLH